MFGKYGKIYDVRWGIIYAQPKSLSRIPRLARQDLAAGFAGALPGLRLAPHIVKHTRATQKNAHVENHTPHHTHTHTQSGASWARADNSTDGSGAFSAAPIGSKIRRPLGSSRRVRWI